MSEAVRYESLAATGAGAGDAIGVVTLDRPDNRNSMTGELLDAFAVAIARARGDAAIRCLVITGSGATFSAGADFKAIAQRGAPDDPPHERSYAMYEPFLAVLDVEVPVIGALNGHAIGGGFGLALVCDIRIGARGAKYGANFVRLGLSPGMAISYLLPRIVGVSRASELLLTGRLIDGEEAERIGLVSVAVDPAAVVPRAIALAREIATNAPLAVAHTKAHVYRGLAWDPRGHACGEARDQATTLATADAAEGIAALLGKRVPRFTGK